MTRSRFAIATAVVCVACVKVPDSVKGTFAERQNGETDNFSPSSPHSIAPPDTTLTQATVSIADASVTDASQTIGVCPRDENASTSSDAGPMISSPMNCLQDASTP